MNNKKKATLAFAVLMVFVIGITFATMYWSDFQQIEQEISDFGSASLKTPVMLSPVTLPDTTSHIETEVGALTLDTLVPVYINWNLGTTTPAVLTTVYQVLSLELVETVTEETINLLDGSSSWKSSKTYTGAHTFDYKVTWQLQSTATATSVKIPLTVSLTDS